LKQQQQTRRRGYIELESTVNSTKRAGMLGFLSFIRPRIFFFRESLYLHQLQADAYTNKRREHIHAGYGKATPNIYMYNNF
jgi:hypothetical protein